MQCSPLAYPIYQNIFWMKQVPEYGYRNLNSAFSEWTEYKCGDKVKIIWIASLLFMAWSWVWQDMTFSLIVKTVSKKAIPGIRMKKSGQLKSEVTDFEPHLHIK